MPKTSELLNLHHLPKIGKRVLVKKPHPHGGKTGTVTEGIDTPVGFGVVVKFDDGLRGTVFKNHKWEYV